MQNVATTTANHNARERLWSSWPAGLYAGEVDRLWAALPGRPPKRAGHRYKDVPTYRDVLMASERAHYEERRKLAAFMRGRA